MDNPIVALWITIELEWWRAPSILLQALLPLLQPAAVAQPQSRSLSRSAGCKNHSALKDLRNSAIVPNLNGFVGRRCADGFSRRCQIRRSIVHTPVPSRFNCAPLRCPRRLFVASLSPRSCAHLVRYTHSIRFFPLLFYPSAVSLRLSVFPSSSVPFFLLRAEERDKKKSFFFQRQSGRHNYTNQQTRLSLACPSVWPRTLPPPPLTFQTLWEMRCRRTNDLGSTPFLCAHQSKRLALLCFCLVCFYLYCGSSWRDNAAQTAVFHLIRCHSERAEWWINTKVAD